MKRMTSLALLLAGGLAAAPAIAMEMNYATYDADQSGSLTQEEFQAGLYADLDADQSGMIEEQEFAAGDPLFGEGNLVTADANADGMIDEDEFNAYYGESELQASFDADASGDITEDEYNTAFSELELDLEGSTTTTNQ